MVLGVYLMHNMLPVNMENVGCGTTVLGENSFIECYQSVPVNSIIGSIWILFFL